jgi:hypothetical protein
VSQTNLTSWTLDWDNGVFYRPTVAKGPIANTTASLVFAGDWAPDTKQRQRLVINPHAFYGDLLSVFDEADLSVINLEMPVSENGSPITKDGPDLSVEKETVTIGLMPLGRPVICLANNHVMDFGSTGLSMTLNTLGDLGLPALGAGMTQHDATQPFLVEICANQMAFLNVAEGEEAKASPGGPGAALLDVPLLVRQIEALVSAGKTVIVVVHAGREYVPTPPPYIRTAYRKLAEAGASLVIGHHPHVPQGIEVWRGTPIAYSLGNFVSELTPKCYYRTVGYLIRVDLSNDGVVALEVHPHGISNDGLEPLLGPVRKAFLAELKMISEYICSPYLEEVWDAYADLWWDLRFSEELVSFASLLSWQDWVNATRYRIVVGGYRGTRMQRFIRRSMCAALKRIARRLPAQRALDKRTLAKLRNRFDTPAHYELYKTTLEREISGTRHDSAPWAKELLTKWQVL